MQTAMYDAAVAVWRKIHYGLSSALELTATQGRDVWKMYWSAQQRFFKLLCVSIKVCVWGGSRGCALGCGSCSQPVEGRCVSFTQPSESKCATGSRQW